MRNITLINQDWLFSKDNINFEQVNVPHTWNNLDGQDGGADYLRQACFYKKTFTLSKNNQKVFLEFEGVNHIAKVTFNGTYLGEHIGGFSTFRFEVTDLMVDGENTIEVTADNSEGLQVYPQQADFTFFGGIYRNVKIIEVEHTHFDLEFYGSAGVYVTPIRRGNDAKVDVLAYVKGQENLDITFKILDKEENVVASVDTVSSKEVKSSLEIKDVNLWNGKINPYLYTLVAQIKQDGAVLDCVTVDFGVRSYEINPDFGFVLNSKDYSLRGVSRHQDKFNKGWAICPSDQDLDMEIIKEVGANTLRLAHYQHNQYFYDLCDKEGMVVWAEIPFITSFMNTQEAKDDTISQMRELVLQNYNHPSICFWGISNEITISGESDELLANQKALIDVVHEYDVTRPTTLANVSFVDIDSPQNDITDIVAYNHYFGWYGGELTDNEEWIDEFHNKYPDKPLCISEYGAEGIMTLHSDTPEVRDYSEEYHAVYHEHMLKVFEARPFLWATYQWNMFDFAADARDEGGVQGRNNKGLVSYDRQTKKDAFYLYKAYWNKDEKFVHVNGRRYLDRATETTNIKVYSNEAEVTLIVNGVTFGTLTADKVFVFENVPLAMGQNTIKAVTECSTDEIILNRQEEANMSYVLPKEEVDENATGVTNWFEDLQDAPKELTFNAGYFSIKDTIGDVLANPEGAELFSKMMAASSQGMTVNEGMLKMISGMKLEVVLKMAGKQVPKDFKYIINAKLQKIKK